MKVESVKYEGKELRERITPKSFIQFLIDCYFQLKYEITKKPIQYEVNTKNGVVTFNRTPADSNKVSITWSTLV